MANEKPFPTNPLLPFLQGSHSELIRQFGFVRDYHKDQFIVFEDDPPTNIHILLEGIAKCVKTSMAGRSVTLKLFFKGDSFSTMTYPGCIQALGDVRILKIDRKVIFLLTERVPELKEKFALFLAALLRQAHEAAAAFALYSAEQRLALLLVSVANRVGTPTSGGIRVDIQLSRQDFADMAGLTPDTTSRILTQFRQAGFIQGNPRNLLICDLPGLQLVGEGRFPQK